MSLECNYSPVMQGTRSKQRVTPRLYIAVSLCHNFTHVPEPQQCDTVTNVCVL
jgi:hypothetical protein